ncbi:hypothetical protein [Streptomyces qinzhouensis]|nr:hypothetical protein [Streptomyces qinzhouensis]
MGGFQDRDKFHPDEVVLSPAERQTLAELTDKGDVTEPADES